MKKIGWIGLGKCGLPIAERISQTCDVIAYDKLPKETPIYTSNIVDLMQTEITFILVETPHINKTLDGSVPIDLQTVEDYDYTAVNNVLLTLANHNYQGVVVISSTVSPGTTKQLAKKIQRSKNCLYASYDTYWISGRGLCYCTYVFYRRK